MSSAGEGAACPVPFVDSPRVLLAHGGGGALMHRLLDQVILPAFRTPAFTDDHDGATFAAPAARLAFTTDSYVIHPLIFPGGDIGSLAVHGTVNDLAMCGARPKYLSAGLIIEEGLPIELLQRIMHSMRRAADAAGAVLVTGDTKVVDRGKGDGLFINTAGIGAVEHDLAIRPASVCEGDAILLSGDVGRHGIAIMALREGLRFESAIESDSTDVSRPVLALIDAGIAVHCLRDCTRGGVAGSLIEIARTSGRDMRIRETDVPVREDVRGACEVLGLDPLMIANEGRFVAFVPAAAATKALAILRSHAPGASACVIGQVGAAGRGVVTMESVLGTVRMLDMPSGEQLPRIC